MIEGLFDRIRVANIQAVGLQFIETVLHLLSKVFKACQPEVFALFWSFIFLLGPYLLLLPADFIDCPIRMRADMEAVLRDISIGQILGCRPDVGALDIRRVGFAII